MCTHGRRHIHAYMSIRSSGELSSSELIGSHVRSLQQLSAADQQYDTHRQAQTKKPSRAHPEMCGACVRASGKINKACITTGTVPGSKRMWRLTIAQIKTQRFPLFAKAAQACDGVATTITSCERNCCTSQADSLSGGFKMEYFIFTAAFSPPQK